jgi:hypothetical protein
MVDEQVTPDFAWIEACDRSIGREARDILTDVLREVEQPREHAIRPALSSRCVDVATIVATAASEPSEARWSGQLWPMHRA